MNYKLETELEITHAHIRRMRHELKRVRGRLTETLVALHKIAQEPEGVYSIDPVEYRDNVIKWCQNTARDALSAVAKEVNE